MTGKHYVIPEIQLLAMFHKILAHNWKKYTPEQLVRIEIQRKIWSDTFKQQNPLLEINTVEFSIFDDMLAYSPLLKYHLNTSV
ncbi:hypothetical protein BKG91_04180 [Rodentibacter caecimuris]|uniref:Uncharacterized protein n=1 Tax=Rodentibacter caecimuris TaxID=1796644 RepID=A0AAJ3K3I1_9PAST|nr:hypothetical protein [Rodentibacter heylii]AOF52753.1 hypothetical protein AC062_0657 [Pasteurellaceae bacterium NI1060]OOF70405.1 hypothetical protein BKG90_10075 [Rodentibacter heylii]OOF75127.1 hypothetical protein BKG91_04180 [Rodentibacter heylii]OOF78481.1 hypothetical protein BKG99_00465 [Rodentibacter heylii]